MTKNETENLSVQFWHKELNRLSRAKKQFQNAELLLEKENLRYSEVVENMGRRSWVYTKYDTLIKDMLEKYRIKDFIINKYNDSKVFKNILNLNDIYFQTFSISKNVMEVINPKSIKELAIVFAIGNIGWSYSKKIFKIIKNNIANPIIKKSPLFFLFEEEILRVLNLFLNDKKESDWVYNMIKSTRYLIGSFDKDKILEIWEDKPEKSLLQHMKLNHNEIFTSCIKIVHNAISPNLKTSGLNEKQIDEFFDLFLLGCFTCCKQKQALNCAKQLYKITKIEMFKNDDFEKITK